MSTVINFARGLTNEDDDEEDDKSATKIIDTYSSQLFSSLIALLKKAIADNYEPLQQEVMSLLSIIAGIIESEFAKYYNEFMPLLMSILVNVGMVT